MVNKGRKRTVSKGTNLEAIAFVSAKEIKLQKETEEKIQKMQEQAKKKLEEEAKLRQLEEELNKVKIEKEKLENFVEYKPVHSKDNLVYGHFLENNPDIEVKIYDQDINTHITQNILTEEPTQEQIEEFTYTPEANEFQASLQNFFKDVSINPEIVTIDEPKKIEKIITPPIESQPQQVETFNNNYKQMIIDRNKELSPQHYTKQAIKSEPIPTKSQEVINPIQGRNVAVVSTGRAILPSSRVASRVAK